MSKIKKKRNKKLLFFYAILPILAVGLYVYKNVLPYHFSPQWKVTPENINPTGEYDSQEENGVFLGKKVRSYQAPDSLALPQAVLGESSEPKRIEVDLANQKVYAIEGETKKMEFLISSGKWGRTPTGHFTIEYKNRAQKMSGGSKELGTYYYLPNVQFVQFFGNDEIPWWQGFGFHGTYWHENFGQPMSHGCINMRNEDAEALYYWTNPDVKDKYFMKSTEENLGTKVIIYGEAPAS